MSSEVLVAVLSLMGTFLGTLSGTKLMSYRIEQLEKKVEKHNNVIERMAVMENKMNTAEQRLSGLESNERRTGAHES